MKIRYHFKALTIGTFLLMLTPTVAMSQFTAQWLDIGTFHSTYTESGAQHEGNSSASDGMEWPAILRNSSHYRARALWAWHKELDRLQTGKTFRISWPVLARVLPVRT